MDDETRVAAIRERAEAATEGPWDVASRAVGNVWIKRPWPEFSHDGRVEYVLSGPDDCSFIAHAREDIPWLLDRLRAAEAELAATTGPFACCKCCAEGIDPELHAEEGRNFHDEPCTSCERETALGQAKIALAAAEARAAEAEAVIAETPHADTCAIEDEDPASERPDRCDCWKSRYRAGADHE